MASNNVTDGEIKAKRLLLKRCNSNLSKYTKALELETVKFDNLKRIRELKQKAITACDTFEKELQCANSYFEEEERTEFELAFHRSKTCLDRYIIKIREFESVDMDRNSAKSNSSRSSKKSSSTVRTRLKLEHIRQRQELERKQERLSLKQSEIQRELEILSVKQELTASDLSDSSSSEYDTVDCIPKSEYPKEDRVSDYIRGLPEDRSYYGRDEHTPDVYNCGETQRDGINKMVKNMTEVMHEQLSLPKPEILSFSGNPMDYPKFTHNFETNIEAKVSDDSLRLSYLIQYCQNGPKQCIEDCVILPPKEGYTRAKQILQQTYGKPHLIARSHVDKLINGNPIKSNDVQALMTLSLSMEKCQITLSQIGFESDINNTENLKKIVRRLPFNIRSKWVEKSSYILERGLEPNFSDLLAFIQQRVNVANTMYGLDLANESMRNAPRQASRPTARQTPRYTFPRSEQDKGVTLSTSSSDNAALPNARARKQAARVLSCVYCTEPHKLINCGKFREVDINQRYEVVRKAGMCQNCLMFNHAVKDCRKQSCCTFADCKQKHHSVLHSPILKVADNNSGNSNCCASFNDRPSRAKVSLRIVPISVRNGANEVQTYALLDEGSDITLCSDSLVKRLKTTGKRKEFTLTTVNHSSERRTGVELKLQVSALNGSESILLNRVWSVGQLPISLSSLPNEEEIDKWQHLSGIHLPRICDAQVEILIGSDNPDVFWVQEQRQGKSGEPYAIRSILGWSILGPVGSHAQNPNVHANFQQNAEFQTEIDRLWQTDFPECMSDNKTGMSQEDRIALSIMERTIELENGHYKLGLPWRDKDKHLKNNKLLASTRLSYLKRKLEKNTDLYSKYRETMNGYIEKGYASRVESTDEYQIGKVSYVPHHPVINPNKPGKVRVVFDCAAKYQGKSLNDHLLQGPDLMNSIIGVLIRFRQEKVALVADIESMFHQVKVSDSDRDALRFLWWPDGDMSKQPVEYRMNVHLFGATNSPSCAAYSLKRTGVDNAADFSKDVVTSIERNFYVDDLLKSVSDEKTGVRISSELIDILSRGGFRLTKWVSNSDVVMNAIPESERAETSKRVHIENDPQLERTLGLQWYVETDTFVFEVSLKDKGYTRRNILSVASSLYDPLGFVAPVSLIPKLVLQNACRQKIKWDQPITNEDARKWDQWLQQLPELSKVSIDRCLKPRQLDESTSVVELHMFSDASEVSYSSAVYAKIYDVNGNSKCSLIIGKSRLAPIKTVSIPRLELAAAVLSVKLYRLVTQELDLVIKQRYFWTDSMIVLGYINNEKKRFKTFVANRLAVIHDVTSPKDWRYVPTNLNPADIGSRGISPSETNKLETWISGPTFLSMESSQWPTAPQMRAVDVNDVEIKTVLSAQASEGKCPTGLEVLINKYSDWYKLKRAVGWLLRFKSYLIQKFKDGKKMSHVSVQKHDLTVTELRNATHAILNLVQCDVFRTDIKEIKITGRCTKTSSLVKLDPIYTDSLLRVGGRLANAEINYEFKHPVILPNKHHVTKLIIRDYHNSCAHMGPHHVLSLLRQKYWVINGLRTVKLILNDCMECKRRHQRPQTQKMGQLPAERLKPDKAPFTYVGIDYFGPMYVKSGRKHMKRYGCLFTCLATRAVHVEIAHSLDTNSFICALQRFVSRRGRPELIYSDNGTNLKAGEKELRESIRSWNQSKISRQLNQHEVVWNFIPPYASHMGGVWERLVRSVKTALKSVIKEQLLNDEALLTLCAEVEKILNDRPITQISDDPRDPEPLTPSKLLLFRSNICMPPGEFDKNDNYCRRWWRQVQYLANVFWRRWMREYLPCLQVRQKWPHAKRNLEVNDLVLVCDENSSRGQWPLGRVLEVKEGRDALVRSCKVRVNGSEKVRPISKLCLLEQHNA